MAAEVQYRNARRKDLSGIAHVFLSAFPESVRHYAGRIIKPKVIEDAFAIAFDAEREALFVTEVNGKIAGYIFAPSKFSRIPQVAITRGHLLKLIWRWITGRYGIGLRPVLVAARNWLSLLREARESELHAEARILSVAVDPNYQGLGIGTKLMQMGLDYLQSRGEKLVRLEARPDNKAAVHIYKKLGFETKGRTRDTQGEWLIMVCTLSENDHA